jgi:hypothetical protein
LGRYSAGSGDIQEITISTGLSLDGSGNLTATGGGGGEANTASNVGTGGVGVFKQKTGVDLEFKKINAGSSKVTITDDTGNSEIDVDVVPANFTGIPQSAVTNLTTDLAAKAANGANTDITSVYLNNTGLKVKDTNASHGLTIAPGSNITADRTLTVVTGDADRTLTLSGNTTLSGTNTGDQTITLTGDVTGSGTGSFAATIAANAVTFAKMQAVSANVLLGNDATGTAVEEITCTAAGRALIDDADAAAQRTTLGLGTLATQSGTFSGTSSGTNTGDQTITLTGDVTGSGTGSFAATIANDAVTFAKTQNIATNKLLGRYSAGSGDIQEITISTGLSLDGSGNLTATGGGSGDVATDAIWDAKGDLAGGTGANTAARLAVGSNGQVLTADSAEATGMKWATPSGGSSPVVISPSQITADQDDYNPTDWDTATVVRLNFDASGRAITSFDAETTGEEKTLVNSTGFWAYIPSEHPDGTAANRVAGEQDHILEPHGAIRIIYDGTSSRWRVTHNTFNAAALALSARGQFYQITPGSTNQSDHPFLGLAQAGTGASNGNAASTTSLPGAWDLTTGTTATGVSTMYLIKNNVTWTAFGAAHICSWAWVYIPTLSTSAQRFMTQLSITASPSGTTQNVNNSIGIRHDDATNLGKWQVFSRDSGGTETTADSGITVAANTLYMLRCWIDKGRTEARFSITDGTNSYVGRIATNLPAAAVCGTRMGAFKSVGTTSRTLNTALFGGYAIY